MSAAITHFLFTRAPALLWRHFDDVIGLLATSEDHDAPTGTFHRTTMMEGTEKNPEYEPVSTDENSYESTIIKQENSKLVAAASVSVAITLLGLAFLLVVLL